MPLSAWSPAGSPRRLGNGTCKSVTRSENGLARAWVTPGLGTRRGAWAKEGLRGLGEQWPVWEALGWGLHWRLPTGLGQGLPRGADAVRCRRV